MKKHPKSAILHDLGFDKEHPYLGKITIEGKQLLVCKHSFNPVPKNGDSIQIPEPTYSGGV